MSASELITAIEYHYINCCTFLYTQTHCPPVRRRPSEEDIQLARLIDRNQMSEANAKKRIQSQMSLSKKCDLSHFVIDNSGSVRDTEEEAQKILNLMVESNHHWKLRGILLGTAALMLSGIAWYINSRNKITGQH